MVSCGYNGSFLTSICVSEFYNTQIDEMPLNVACVFPMSARNMPLPLMNQPTEISSKTTHPPLLLTTSSRFRSRFSLGRCHFPVLTPHFSLYFDKCQSRYAKKGLASSFPSAMLFFFSFSSFDVPQSALFVCYATGCTFGIKQRQEID